MRAIAYICVFIFIFNLIYCNDVTCRDLQTPQCVSKHHRLIVKRQLPARDYLYYHEAVAPHQFMNAEIENDNELQLRIVGGDQVDISDVPYQVLYGLYCGGALIAPNWVITAAHCKENDNFVLAGSTQPSLAYPYPISALFTHPLWNSIKQHHFDFDYKLVLLEKAIPVTIFSMPIAIGDLESIQPGAIVTVSGWGHTRYMENVMQDIVRKVHIPIMERQYCQSLPWNNYKLMTPRMFCAGLPNGNKGVCQGDSGGPAVVNGKLVGLVSFGLGCAEKDHPGVYSNVPMVKDWISSVTGLLL